MGFLGLVEFSKGISSFAWFRNEVEEVGEETNHCQKSMGFETAIRFYIFLQPHGGSMADFGMGK